MLQKGMDGQTDRWKDGLTNKLTNKRLLRADLPEIKILGSLQFVRN